MTVKILLVICITGAIIASQAPKINLVFEDWFSLVIILVLLAGFIGWVAYIGVSVNRIKKRLSQAITKSELADAFEKFKQETKA